jgi:hypothetical protein
MSRATLLGVLLKVITWLRTRRYTYFTAGSMPRGVSLAEDQLDVYVLMPEIHVTDFLTEARQHFCEYDVRRRSRGKAYVTLLGTGWSLDLVPVGDPEDCSILHATYFTPRSACACVRVLEFKTLLRALGLYGADPAVEGFSGFLVELMVERFGGPYEADLAELEIFLKGRIADPCKPSRNLQCALFKGHIPRLLAHLRGLRTGTGKLLVFKAQRSQERDFPAARRYLACVARTLPVQMYTRGPFFYIRAPFLTHRLWVRRSVPLGVADRVTRPLYIADQLVYYEERCVDLEKVPGLVRA